MKLVVHDKRNNKNYIDTWKLNTFLNTQQLTEEIKIEIKKYVQLNDNVYIIYQNLWDAMKPALRGKFVAITSNIKNTEYV